MVHHQLYTDKLRYQKNITPTSPFPEWIETDRLSFKRLSPETVPPKVLYESFNKNDGVDKYFTTRDSLGTTWEDVYMQYEEAEELWESRDFAFYGIFKQDSGAFIGFGTIEDVNFAREDCEIGIWLDKDEWGNGYAQERAEAFFEVIFTHLDLEYVKITVVAENEKSVHSVEKYMSQFGGSFDGILRNETYTPEDEIHDVYKWSISQEEYRDTDAEYDDEVNIW